MGAGGEGTIMQIAGIPRVRLANLPTPLYEAKRLSEALGGPHIFLKRDDLTGVGLGGNKVRKLEFLLGEARNRGANVVLTAGAPQSNHARQTAAAAATLGMEVHLVLTGERSEEFRGNLLISHLLGAHLHFVTGKTMDEAVARASDEMVRLAAELEGAGKEPYVVPVGGAVPLGSVSYALAVLELMQQANDLRVRVDWIVHATGSGGTQAGLLVGTRALRTGIRVLGVRVGYEFEPFEERVSEQANETARLLGPKDVTFRSSDVVATRDYVGEGYDRPTREASEAILLTARCEGVLLDPVYTGKAMAGLIDMVRKGRFGRGEVVVFWHTGGEPALFAGAEVCGPYLTAG